MGPAIHTYRVLCVTVGSDFPEQRPTMFFRSCKQRKSPWGHDLTQAPVDPPSTKRALSSTYVRVRQYAACCSNEEKLQLVLWRDGLTNNERFSRSSKA